MGRRNKAHGDALRAVGWARNARPLCFSSEPPKGAAEPWNSGAARPFDSASQDADHLGPLLLPFDHNESPGLAVLARWRSDRGIQDSLDQPARHGSVLESPDAPSPVDRFECSHRYLPSLALRRRPLGIRRP
jgi:hypothetical protein